MTKGRALAFLGIPYAKPPLNELRWKAPQPVDKWIDVRDASQFGKRCAQRESTTLHNAASEDEDCLYLNVWTAAHDTNDKLPVMIWIHGGGNVNGSASEPLPLSNTGLFYNGQNLAENHPVVVVTFNYRLGVFGFFAHPALTTEGSASGNQGLRDQRAVFNWVKRNITQFGGDPTNVTIFGESAGSLDVCLHVAGTNTTGLFQRAISESGGCTTSLAVPATAEASATRLGGALGCMGDDFVTCMRRKRAADLLNLPSPLLQGFGPIVDGDLLLDQPRTLYDTGRIAVPYLLGSNTDEGTLLVSAMVTNQEELTAALIKSFGELAQPVADLYPVSAFVNAMPNPFQAVLARATGDRALVCSTYDTALRASKSAPAVYLYNFDIPVEPSLSGGSFLGATHGSELTYVFGTDPTLSPPNKLASDRMQRYWTNFAKSGDPNSTGDAVWPKFGAAEDTRLNLALEATVVHDFRAQQCEFWRTQYDAAFSP